MPVSFYVILPLVLIAAYLQKAAQGNSGASKALLLFSLIYVSTGIPFRFFGMYPETVQGYLFVMSSASFVLILLYYSLPMTRLLFLAGLCEAVQILAIFLCYLAIGTGYDIRAALAYQGLASDILNFTALALLIGNRWGGERIIHSIMDARLPPAARNRRTTNHCAMVSGEKTT